jgi:hypothetical protein
MPRDHPMYARADRMLAVLQQAEPLLDADRGASFDDVQVAALVALVAATLAVAEALHGVVFVKKVGAE